jgi:hypothetical protein
MFQSAPIQLSSSPAGMISPWVSAGKSLPTVPYVGRPFWPELKLASVEPV